MKQNRYQVALNEMCKCCSNHEMCMGTGCSPKKALQELVDKSKPMKVFETDHSYICRNCANIFAMKHEGLCVPCLKGIRQCPTCGQKQDWGDVCD